MAPMDSHSGRVEEIYKRRALRFEDEAIGEAICDRVDGPGCEHAQHSPQIPNTAASKKKISLISRSSAPIAFMMPDFARALENGHDHRAGNAKGGHQKRDAAGEAPAPNR